MKINFPPLWKLINIPFIPYWNDSTPVQIFWGGRDASKTNFIVKKLIHDCLSQSYFRCILIRKQYAWVADSQWLSIKDEIDDMGLSSYFKCTTSPYKITCLLNGNVFLCRGADDVNSIKSVKDPTCAWFEEDIVYIPERDYTVISQSLRTSKDIQIKQYFSINPEIKGEDYQENWFWKQFWGEKHKDELTFKSSTEIEIEYGLKKIKKEVKYLVMHSTYKFNRWCPPERRAYHESLKKRNPHWYNIFTLGLWGNKSNDGLFYNEFQRTKQVIDAEYNPERSLHLTWDFNVKPYVSLGIWQYYDDREQDTELWDKVESIQGPFEKLLVKVDEIAGIEPRNRTKFVCQDFSKKYKGHEEGVFIYGDPAGKHEDTRSEKGSDDFNIILKELKSYKPKKRVDRSAPSVSGRREFINSIFGENAYNIAIAFHSRCKYSIIDYTSGQEDADGKKLKKKVKDPETNVMYEKYHHFSDGDDYFICKLLKTEFKLSLRGGKPYEYSSVNPEGKFQHS